MKALGQSSSAVKPGSTVKPWKRQVFSPRIYWGAAGIAFIAVVPFWIKGQAGSDLACLIAAACFAFGFVNVIKGFFAFEEQQYEAAIRRLAGEATDTDGTAKWATFKDAEKAKMDKNSGLFLGMLEGRPLYYPGETHLLTIAPPGAGKGTSIIVPTLLNYRGSVIVTDPKGELFAVTARHQEKNLGQKIIVLCPWAEKMSAELGIRIPDHGFNPLSYITPGSDIKDECELISSILLPRHANMKADDDFWIDGGQTILTACLLHLASDTEKHGALTLPRLRQYLHLPPEEMTGLLYAMSQNMEFGGCIQEYGAALLGTMERSPRQFEGTMGTAQKALRIYDSASPLGQHVSQGALDFKSMKDEPTTIYLVIPSDRSITHAAWLNLVISLAIESVGRDRSNRRVLFLLDEMANLGYIPNILRGMAQYRGQGVQIWSIIQQISQLEKLYGKDGWQQFIGTCELVNAFGVWDPETINLLSKWLGQNTVRNYSYNVNPAKLRDEFSTLAFSTADKGVSLMRPEDIRTMPPDEQLIFYRNVAPVKAKRVHYYEHPEWNKLAAPNPYRRNSDL
jgi:type IV secretion system protein VirD4